MFHVLTSPAQTQLVSPGHQNGRTKKEHIDMDTNSHIHIHYTDIPSVLPTITNRSEDLGSVSRTPLS